MTRTFYRLLLALHPVWFRERFADEMMLMLDEAEAEFGPLYLLSDITQSLVRQWLLRSGVWKFAVGGLVNAAIVAMLVLATDGSGSFPIVAYKPPGLVPPRPHYKIYYYAPNYRGYDIVPVRRKHRRSPN